MESDGWFSAKDTGSFEDDGGIQEGLPRASQTIKDLSLIAKKQFFWSIKPLSFSMCFTGATRVISI